MDAGRPQRAGRAGRGGRRPDDAVVDDGVGLPEDFSVDSVSGLGLSIVRALVTSDLNGTIDMFAPPDGSPGTIVELRLPVRS